jgi:hypothetical protein
MVIGVAQRKNQGTPLPFAPIAVVSGVAGIGVATWFGYPGFPALWLGLVAAAWLAEPGVLTGKKDSYGYPTPANPTEEAQRRHWQMWRQLRTGLIIPNSDWMPGWPVFASWIGAVLAGVVGYLFPVIGTKSIPVASGHLLNALAAFIIVAEVAAVLRHGGPPNHPGTRTDTLKATVTASPNVAIACAIGGALVGLVIAGVVINITPKYGPGFGAPALVAHAATKTAHPAHPGIKILMPSLLWPLLAVLGAMLAITKLWRTTALTKWREVTEASGLWKPRWESLKFDPPPALVDHRMVGEVAVDTFDAPPNIGAMGFWPLGPKLAPTLGAGQKVAILETPDVNSDGPIPGTRHPLRFDVVSWPSTSIPNPASPETDSDTALLFAHSAMVWALEPQGYGRPVPLAVSEITAPGSPVKVWRSQWAWPGGPTLEVARSLIGDIAASFGTEVLIDHRSTDSLYFGALTDANVTFDAESGTDWPSLFASLTLEDKWTGIWENVSKQNANPPTIQHQVSAERPLDNGTVVKRMAFATRLGVEPGEYQGLEKKLATSLDSAPFVAVTGWVTNGERHPQAFTVYWANAAVPSSPDLLSPSAAALWVLAGHINMAFDDSKLARPEIIDAKSLTEPRSRGTLWEIGVRLYDGVTSSDVRDKADRIRKAMRTPWLRVADAPNGCVIFVGADPANANLQSPERDIPRLISLDWEHAWKASGVIGSSGAVPELTNTGTLPSNGQVQILDFALPPGTDRAKVKMGLSKLGAATGNLFVEIRESPNGASSIRLLASKESPLPDRVAYDFDAADRVDGIVCATGIEGEPVVFDPKLDPHLLIAGLSGGGKSSFAQVILYGAAANGSDLYIIDPVKGAADFKFAADHAKAIATNPAEASAAMKAIYAEVVKRKNANSEAGVGSFRELPDPPPLIVVLIDEFSSLIGQSLVPKPSDDIDMELEREAVIADNLSRQEIGVFAGKIAREARSAGVVLLLATQRLSSKMLESIPGASDLRTNLSRVLLGKASSGDRMVALRSPDDAPELDGEIPIGRGIFETTATRGAVVQCWYAPQSELNAQLNARVPALHPDQKTDLRPFMPKSTTGGLSGKPPDNLVQPQPESKPGPEPEVLDIGEISFSLDDLDADTTDPDTPTAPDVLQPAPQDVATSEDVLQPAPQDVATSEDVLQPAPQDVPTHALSDTVDWSLNWDAESTENNQEPPAPDPVASNDDPFAAPLPPPPPTPATTDDDPFAAPPARPAPSPATVPDDDPFA